MRRLIAISSVLIAYAALNAPVMAQPPVQVAKSPVVVASSSNLGQLRINRRLWNQQRIYNYRYTLSRSCFCTEEARGPVIIEVRNGRTTSIKYVATGKPANPELFRQYSTVPKLFNIIRDAIAQRVSSLNVEYNSQLGYPTQINIDFKSQVADEELFLTVENLQVLR
ncbi:MAG: hypothetical protein KME21_03235 [Desmonostoc vinosum HA7617-LM4]|jgi:hypothetical protein|nr:hypothetical protein [Desmonostoc vinosum HA7617-LM4]